MGVSTGGRKELRRQLEENPDWESDLLALYGFDIWDAIDGRVPIRQAYAFIGRLGIEPKSIWRAKQLGGPELKNYQPYFGFDMTANVIADLIDTVREQTLTIMSVNAPPGHKLPELHPYPRPGMNKVKIDEPKESLADFGSKLIGLFGAGIGG